MPAIADLEVGIHRNLSGSFTVSLRKTAPENESDQTDLRVSAEEVKFDLDALRQQAANAVLGNDVADYGQILGGMVFGIPQVRKFFDQSIAADQRLRFRLFIGPSAVDLHEILWETLPDPTAPPGVDQVTLATSDRIVFSRYLGSEEWRPLRLRRKSDMRALVAIADPSNIGEWANGEGGPALARIDVPGELDRARSGLEDCGIEVDHLTEPGSATLDNIVARLADGYDIFYLVCHGQRVEGQPLLWLENPDGTADVVSGARLSSAVWKLEQQPRLVVLASCMSAGGDSESQAEDRGALAGVGPLLASIGIPAVLAMQGNVSMETVKSFMPAFFDQLQENGRVDQAVAAARAAVADRPDAWMPVLFMRLRTGRIWYEPGMVVGAGQQEFDWKDLITSICEQRCTVVLGSGLLEGLVGSPRTIARRWAENRKFPLAAHQMDDLPRIAQYVSTQTSDQTMRADLRKWLKDDIIERHHLPKEAGSKDLLDVMGIVGKEMRERDDLEPHDVLARLPFPVYITTNPDNLLTDALTDVGRKPEREVLHWRVNDRPEPRSGRRKRSSRGDEDENGALEPWDRPLVYHLFGHLEEENRQRLVITEDHYFDYLIGVTSNKELIPGVVREALSDRTLLFLGFQMSDWVFRILLRMIASQESHSLLEMHSHVAVQVDPEDDRVLDTAWARRYLEKYFRTVGVGPNPTIYWGSSADFLRELRQRWTDEYGALPEYPMNLAEPAECSCNPKAAE